MPQKPLAFLSQEFCPACGRSGGSRRRHDLAQPIEETGPQASHQPGNHEFFRRRLAQHVQVDVRRLVMDLVKVALHPLEFFGREQCGRLP